MTTLQGSCCCQAVRFEVDGQPEMMATCHCTRCRKVGASIFVFVKRDTFRLVDGEALIARYEPEPGQKYVRCFCSKCGTALGEMTSTEDSFPVPANCVDDALTAQNRFHEFVAEKPAWLRICDDARQFDAHPVRG